MDIGKRVVMHGLAEVDGVENLDAVRFINHLPLGVPQRLSMLVPFGCAALEQPAAFHQDGALGVCDHIGAVHLHQVRFQPESGFTGTGTADYQHIFVSGSLGVLGAAGHGEALGLGQNDVIIEHRVHVGGDIVVGAP